MCLYPRIIKNPKYVKNAKNGGIVPKPKDGRLRGIQIPCGRCIECRRQKASEWRIRLAETIKKNINAIFVTLTFSNESLKNLEYKEEDPNAVTVRALSLFRKRWYKKYKKPLKHWLISELGHDNTERIHLHGLIWTTLTEEEFEKEWSYGWVYFGKYVNMKTINYIVKYITKIDEDHPEFTGKILTSKNIGIEYLTEFNLNKHKYKPDGNTKEKYRTNIGTEIGLTQYYRNKIYSDEERELLRIEHEDQAKKYIYGIEVDTKNFEGKINYIRGLEYYQSQHPKYETRKNSRTDRGLRSRKQRTK